MLTFPALSPNLFSIRASNSFPLTPLVPRATYLLTTCTVIMILFTVFLIDNLEYPDPTKALEKNSCTSALKTPSATNFFFYLFLYPLDL